jgi:hypothetical protein
VSFYCNLLGWKETFDEGSQNECMIGDIGDIIIRGGNPLDPNFEPATSVGEPGHGAPASITSRSGSNPGTPMA